MEKGLSGSGIRGERLLYALMLLPFFEPLSFNLFIRYHSHEQEFSLLADAFMAGRILVSAWA